MEDRRLIFDTLRRDLPIDDVLAALGGERTPEVMRVAEQLREEEPRIRDWLAANPDRLDDFVRNPVEVLNREFPFLDVPERPRRRRERLPREMSFEVVPAQPPAPAMELFAEVWAWVAASQQNTDAFAADALAVIRAVGAQTGTNPATTEQVILAMEHVLGIYRIQTPQTLSALNYAVSKGQLP